MGSCGDCKYGMPWCMSPNHVKCDHPWPDGWKQSEDIPCPVYALDMPADHTGCECFASREPEVCEWTKDDDDPDDIVNLKCGEWISWEGKSPKFCPGCGKPVVLKENN